MTEGANTSESLDEYLARVNLSGARLAYFLAAFLMPAGLLLDWVTHPEAAASFLWIRLAAGGTALAMVPICSRPIARRYPVVLGFGPPFICAAGIELMIVRIEGYASPYYAGLNLCILAVGVLYTWPWRASAFVCATIIAMWLVPVITTFLRGAHIDLPTLFNNLYFLQLTSVIAVASSVIRLRLAKNEFEARTELAKTSSELEGTLRQLQELDRLKGEFFANISHELRTPLTLILAPVDSLLEQTSLAPQRNALMVIRRNAERLLRLIDDLLDLGKLEIAGLRLYVGPVDLCGLASAVVEACKPAASARSISLQIDAGAFIPDMHGDPHRLEMVLMNLVGNALKFTPNGGHIKVTARAESQGATVLVADDGPGIAKEEMDRIFDRFYQIEGSARRKHGGAGIGLALARELTGLHEGTLTVESELGRGSTFRLWLPKGQEHFRAAVVERRRVHVDDHSGRRNEDRAVHLNPYVPKDVAIADSDEIRLDFRRARILVAEDEADLREFIASFLNKEFEVTLASNGVEALARVRAERPDLVISDVMMPELSGTDLCRKMKEDPALQGIPVILLTARSGSETALEGYASGADDFVTKPFHARVLIARARAQLRIRALGLQLAAQSRLSLAATLTAGVAHEVRNPLNALVSAVAVLRTGTASQKTSGPLLDVINEGAQRIAGVISVLDDHVRPADGERASFFNVANGLDSTITLLGPRLDGIAVHRSYKLARTVIAPPRELNQVFLNLIDNAIRANPRNIWILTEEAEGKFRVVVSDDGPGVPREVASRIFDPFFTTRPVGEGTGLGLYLSRKIALEHGGDLRLEGRAGGGASFVIQLPTDGAEPKGSQGKTTAFKTANGHEPSADDAPHAPGPGGPPAP